MSSRKKYLNEEEIANILSTWYDSEDGLDCSDEDDVADPTYTINQDRPEISDDEEPSETENEDLPDVTPQPSTSTKPLKVRVTWKKKNLELNDDHIKFRGTTVLPAEVLELQTPYQFFNYLFSQEIIEHITEHTNLYSVQKDANRPINVNSTDIRQFIGIIYYMAIVHLPTVRKYWSEKIGFAPIKETMTSKRFEKLRQTLHFNDNSKMPPYTNPNCDRLFKIRPVIEMLNLNYKKVPLEAYLSIDEQMCSTKARSVLKQYLPDKPNKWGYKLFVLCGVSGFAYKFEVYSGKENILVNDEPQLGASANVVVRLLRNVPTNNNYRIFFDNYYTSLPLIEYLAKRGFLGLGTVRRNRIPNSRFPDDKTFKKQPRGTSVEYVGNHNGVDISTICWMDNKIVTLASNFAGKNPTSTVSRYDKSKKERIAIERPFVVAEYNRHMGGVDLLDSIMGRYKIKLRSKRWYLRLFYHFLDLTISNAWLLYRRVHKESGKTDKHMNSADFRLEVAETLCKLGMKEKTCKRKSDVEHALQEKKKKGPAQYVPPKDVRQDQFGHWPEWTEKRMRCKKPNCPGFTQTLCEKCGVALCFNKKNNCFKNFHLD